MPIFKLTDRTANIEDTRWWSSIESNLKPVHDPIDIAHYVYELCKYYGFEPILQSSYWDATSPGLLYVLGTIEIGMFDTMCHNMHNDLKRYGLDTELVMQKKAGRSHELTVRIIAWSPLPELPLRDLWPSIFNAIPLSYISDCRLYLVNHKSNELFRKRWFESIRDRSWLVRIPEGTVNIFGSHSITPEGYPSKLELINSMFPDYMYRQLRRGDVVQFLDAGEYRNQGKFIWDGAALKDLTRDVDDYGNLPSEFTVDQVPSVRYWSKSIEHNQIVWLDISKYDIQAPNGEWVSFADNYRNVCRPQSFNRHEEGVYWLREHGTGRSLFLICMQVTDAIFTNNRFACDYLEGAITLYNIPDELIKCGASVDNTLMLNYL